MAKSKILSKPDLDRLRIRQKLMPVHYYEPFVSDLVRDFAKNKRYYIRTYGCQANIRDEEVISAILERAGFVRAASAKSADFIMLNTCAVRENAEDKVLGELGTLKALKSTNKDLIIAVSGCMSQQEHIIDSLLEKYPQVDLILGTHNIHKIIELIDIHLRESCRVVDVLADHRKLLKSYHRHARRNTRHLSTSPMVAINFAHIASCLTRAVRSEAAPLMRLLPNVVISSNEAIKKSPCSVKMSILMGKTLKIVMSPLRLFSRQLRF